MIANFYIFKEMKFRAGQVQSGEVKQSYKKKTKIDYYPNHFRIGYEKTERS